MLTHRGLADVLKNAPRLSQASLAALAPSVSRPGYRRDAVGTRVVHIGVGAFMRAHTAVYIDDVLAADGGDWAIAGVSLRRPDVFEQLAPQDCLYMLAVAGRDRRDYRLIGALREMHVAAGNPESVIELLARTGTAVVTITVTEKGYCIDAQAGGLDAAHPEVVHDLGHVASPRSLVGILHAACVRRSIRDAGPFTVLSCDNLPANGKRLRRAVLDFAALAGRDMESWIRDNVAFPSTMVDRIVPATTDRDIADAAAATGVFDAALVCTEAFTQWIIEDHFANARPAWERAGALLVDNVEPYETAKLRLLNGAHSAIAYLGFLSGHVYVHEAMQDAALARYVEHLMRTEISPVTPAPAGMEHERYIPALIERFRKPALMHRTWQIAMDGSQKLPQRLLATIRHQLGRGGPIALLSLAVAAWIRYTLGRDERGDPVDVRDPLAGTFAAIAAESGGRPAALVDAYLGLAAVFGEDLRAAERLRHALVVQLESLLEHGAAATVHTCLEKSGDR